MVSCDLNLYHLFGCQIYHTVFYPHTHTDTHTHTHTHTHTLVPNLVPALISKTLPGINISMT